MERAAEVVLEDLALVERPAMVLVLAVVPPPPAQGDADVDPVVGQASGGGPDVSRTPAISAPTPWRARTASRSPRTSARARRSRAAPRRRRRRPRRARRSAAGRPDRGRRARRARSRRTRTAPARPAAPTCRGRKSLSLTRSGHGSSRRLAGWRRGRCPALGRHLVPHGLDAGTAHAGVAGERAQRDAAGRACAPWAAPAGRAGRPGPATRCGPAASRARAACALPFAAGPVRRATPMPAHASSAMACSVSSASHIAQSCPSATVSSGVAAAARTMAQAVATRSGRAAP